MTIAVDWDGVLADPQSQEWLPGAQAALRKIIAEGHTVVVHTCRANWPEGAAAVEAKLAAAGLAGVEVVGKPRADVYVDDRAVHFDRDWEPVLRFLAGAPRPSSTPRPRQSAPTRRRQRMWS